MDPCHHRSLGQALLIFTETVVGHNDPVTHDPTRALDLERTVYFSDAVIAIALTLLALELPVPHNWHELPSHGGSYISFLISFAVISTFWFRHHQLFQKLERVDARVTLLNLLSLFAIVVVPFATKALPESDPKSSFGPVIYASTMVLWAIAYVLMVLAANRAHLWHHHVAPATPRNMIFGACAALGIFAVSIPIAFASPGIAQLTWLLIPFVATIAGRLRRRFG